MSMMGLSILLALPATVFLDCKWTYCVLQNGMSGEHKRMRTRFYAADQI